MTGYGSYGIGGPYPSSSSSLSALAPPFTVDRSIPKPISSPLVDVTEPPYVAPSNSSLHNWLPSPTTGSNFFASSTPEFDSTPSSSAYRYASLPTVDSSNRNLPPVNTITAASSTAFTYDVAATTFVEAKPYYPSYLSPTIHGDSPLVVSDQPSYDWLSTSHFAPLDGPSHKDYTQRPSGSKYTAQWGGLWNGMAKWEQGKQGEFDGSFCSKETDVSGSLYKNYMNQEPHSSNSLNSCEEACHGINILGWDGSVNAEPLGDKSFVGKNSKFIPTDFSKSIMGPPSVVPETHLKALSSQFVTKTTNCKTPFSVSCEKQQYDAGLDDVTSISKSSPAFVIRPPAIGTKSLEPEIGLFKRLNSRNDVAVTDHGDCYRSFVKESYLPQSSEGKVLFDSSQLGIHLGTNDPFFVELSTTRNKELSNNKSISKDALGHMFTEKPGLENSHISPDGFNVALKTNESINSFLNSSENLDPNNPSVDSPCWKGVSGSHFSPFKASEDGVLEQLPKLEDCSGLNLQMPLIFPRNAGESVSSQKPIKNTVGYHEFGWMENDWTLPLKRSSVENSAFGEHKLDNTVKTTYHSERSHDRGLQSYSVIHKSGNGDKSLGLFEHSHAMQQGHGEGGSTTEAKNTTWSCGADVKLNINDPMEYGSSPVASPAVENMLCSPSVEDTATKLTKSNGEESVLKMDVQRLVNTMNSLSEILLINCSFSSYQLQKKDLEALKAVIKNLNFCILKNDGKRLLMEESPSFQQNTSWCSGELSEHHKVVNVDSPQLTKIFPPNIQNPLDLQDPLKLYKSVKNSDDVRDSVSVKSDVDMMKEDKMTEALKKILSENFHVEETHPQTLLYKNLWLEAEALLCSTNYKARFNRMKVEMDKCKADKSKDVLEYTADMMKQSRSGVSPDSNPVDKLTPEDQGSTKSILLDLPIVNQEDDVMARFHILRTRVENSNSIDAAHVDESSSKVSPEPNKVDKIAPEANGSPPPGISIQDSPISSTTGLTNDYEASVMARFHIIRNRVEKSKFINAANVEEPSSSKVSLEPEIDDVAPETCDSSMPEFNIPDSPVLSTTSQANDFEGSVMARFHTIKSRVDNCSDMHKEGQLPEIDLGYAGKRNLRPIISKRSEDGSSDVKEQPILQSHKADTSEDKLVAAREFRLFVEDDPGTQPHRIHRPANQLPAAWHDSSSSDWEHVMKEELWGQNC